MVAAIVALSALLYVTVTGLLGSTTGVAPLTVDVTQDGSNWTVHFTGVPGGRLPADMFLVIRDASDAIILRRTPFANLTAANWSTNHATYVDANPPVADVRSGDLLHIDAPSYPAGSTFEISDRTGVLVIKVLQ